MRRRGLTGTGERLFLHRIRRQTSGEGCRPDAQMFALRFDNGFSGIRLIEIGDGTVFLQAGFKSPDPAAEVLFKKYPGGPAAFVAERRRLRSVTATIPG